LETVVNLAALKDAVATLSKPQFSLHSMPILYDKADAAQARAYAELDTRSPIEKNLQEIIEKDNIKLNIGCGDNVYDGYINMDKVCLDNVDLVWDLEHTPLPFKDNSVQEIRAEHIMEHVSNFMQLIEELYRICKPDAHIHILAPYYKYEGAFRDPTHKSFFTEHSFAYFQEGVKFSHYSPARFKLENVEKRVRYLSDVKSWQKKVIKKIPNFLRPAFDLVLWSMYTEIKYDLKVVK
jgi:SAM-dependent methyltransferase